MRAVPRSSVARRLGAASAVLALSIGALLAGALPASAHDQVVSSTPASGATVTAQPGSFSIVFDDVVLDLGDDGAGAIMTVSSKTRGSTLYYGNGCTTIDGRTIATTAALGPAGRYVVTWQAVSADGHTVDGTIPFTWRPGASAKPAAGSTSRPTCHGTLDVASTPAVSATAPGSAGGETVLWIVIAAGAIVVGGGIAFVLARPRRRSEPELEDMGSAPPRDDVPR
jgi:methionine-rich copper-binding protein CopC